MTEMKSALGTGVDMTVLRKRAEADHCALG